MKIFVTGGTGFIGSHLLAQLLSFNHQVVALCRPGSQAAISLKHHPVWLERNSLYDVSSTDMNGVDTVIHLASAGVSPQRSAWNELCDVNITAGLNLIERAHNAGVRRFIAAGTCLEYGSGTDCLEIIPPHSPLRPESAYAASKAAGFLMLEAFAKSNPIEFFYGRIFTAYGDGQYCGNFWPSLRSAAFAGDDFPMTTGDQVRDFIPVTDVARHLRIAVERTDLQPELPFVVNIGSGQGQSLLNFAKAQWKLFNANGKLKPSALVSRSSKMTRLVADLKNLIPAENSLS